MAWIAKEHSTTWLNGFSFDLLPSGLNNKIRFVSHGVKSGIEVEGVVGTVSLKNGETLHITPKVGELNFFRMLLTAEGLYDELAGNLSDSVGYQLSDAQGLPVLLGRRFLSELNYIRAQSLQFKRTKVRVNGDSVAGQIQLAATHLNLLQGKSQPIEYITRKRDYCSSENKILAAAAHYLINGQTRFVCDAKERMTANWWIDKFLCLPELEHDIAEVNKRFRLNKIGGSRGYYSRALTMAKIILGQVGYSQGTWEDIEGDSVLINSATLFEEYLRNVLIRSFKGRGFVITKGVTPDEFLYTNGSYKLTPDICISKGNKLVVIGDAKYKKPDAGDHYQMAAYLDSHGIQTGILFCPNFDGTEIKQTQYEMRNKKRIIEMALPMGDLDATEDALRQLDSMVAFQSH